MTRLKVDLLPQRHIAQQLRFLIDAAQIADERRRLEDIKSLVDSSPISSRSSHVRHNLGLRRLAWLAERGINL